MSPPSCAENGPSYSTPWATHRALRSGLPGWDAHRATRGVTVRARGDVDMRLTAASIAPLLLVAAVVSGGCADQKSTPSPASASSGPVAALASLSVNASAPAVVSAKPTPSSDASQAPTPSPGASQAPTPSAVPDAETIRKAAGRAYLAAVQPTNKAYRTLFKKYKNATSLKANREYCNKLAAADR